MSDPQRRHLRSAFGEDRFGQLAEAFARKFGTPNFLIGQTLFVIAWMIVNAVSWTGHWDPYPFILLNLVFSTQAAYAAPLILLAQTRQADRDRIDTDHRTAHSEQLIEAQTELLNRNEALTQQVAGMAADIDRLSREIRERLAPDDDE